MSRRSLFTAALLSPLVLPLLLPLGHLFFSQSWSALLESERVFQLLANTLGVCSFICLLVVPIGLVLALLLFRTDLPGRSALRLALGVALFVPLPLFALAWQSVGSGGWRPWSQGILPAAIIHALAALPWFVWLTGLALTRVDADLEDQARACTSPIRVLFAVTLRRALPGIALAIALIVLQAAGEIAVTDLMVARTFAEEVYTQFVLGGPNSLGRAVVLALPWTLFAMGAVGIVVRQFANWLPVTANARPPFTWPLGRYRWPVFVGVIAFLAVYLGVPVLALLQQASGGEHGSLARLFLELRRALHVNGTLVLDSLGCALLAGLLASVLALHATLAAIGSRPFRLFLFVLTIALWAVPGPVLGFGLKECIEQLMKLEESCLSGTSLRPLRDALYYEPNPLPVLWAQVARLFPYAVAILWPAVRDVPRDLRESSRVDGATPWREFRHAVWPSVRSSFWIATLAVSSLAMGELAASKIVQIPSRRTFVEELFNQMHYAATATTASLALIQLATATLFWALIAWRWSRPRIS